MDNVDFKKTAIKVSRNSIVWNIILSALKLFAGIFANSSAMISDAVHSASDVFSSIIVVIGVKLASKDSDDDHQYGHDRIEPVAAIVLALVLCITGVFIGHTAIETLTSGNLEEIPTPGIISLLAALVSIIVKEAMYWYTRKYAKLIDSSALMADAWHHRSDALSSIGSLIGIVGSRLGLKWFDAVASLIICVFIVKAAYDIFANSIKKMTDHACDVSVQNDMIKCAKSVDGVEGVYRIKTREFGNKIYVDLEVLANGDITLLQSSEIGKNVHNKMEQSFPKIKHIVVLVKPLEGHAKID